MAASFLSRLFDRILGLDLLQVRLAGEGAVVAARCKLDRTLLDQSIRFALTALVPIVAGMIVGPRVWVLFGMIGGVVSFAGDAGGRPLERLGFMMSAPAALGIGMALGSLAYGDPFLVLLLSIVGALAYGLVEGGHPHLLLASRFLAFGIVFAGLVGSVVPVDFVALLVMLFITWGISILYDRVSGRPRPLSVPGWGQLRDGLGLTEPQRWAFAVAVACAAGLALVVTIGFGSQRPAWACLTVMLVMRSEIASSRKLALEWSIGTFLGVVVALLILPFLDHRGILVVMAIAAFIRWPAQQLYNMLGILCLMVFFMLAIDFVSVNSGQAVALLHERIFDTLVGALSSALALLVYQKVLPLLPEASPGAKPEG